MNLNFYDLYYTFLKNRDEREILNDQYENYEYEKRKENNFNSFEDLFIPNRHAGIKHRETTFR